MTSVYILDADLPIFLLQKNRLYDKVKKPYENMEYFSTRTYRPVLFDEYLPY